MPPHSVKEYYNCSSYFIADGGNLGPIHPLNLRCAEFPKLSGSDTTRSIEQLPALFVSGSTNPDDILARQAEIDHLKQQGFITTQSYIQFSLYEHYQLNDNRHAVGKGFVTEAASDGYVMPANGGVYTIAELVLANKLGFPLKIHDYWLNPPPIHRIYDRTSMCQLIAKDKSSMLDELLRHQDWLKDVIHVDIQHLLRKYKSPLLQEISQHSYWDYIKYYLNSDIWEFDSGINWLQKRLYRALKPWSFKKMQLHPPTDFRPHLTYVQGDLRVMNIVDDDKNSQGRMLEFWHLDEETGLEFYTASPTDTNEIPFGGNFIHQPGVSWERWFLGQ